MAAPKKVDYDRIEAGWRAGLLSPKQLAVQYTQQTGQSVSHAAIIKHFRKQGIARDLSKKITDRANSMVTEAMVTGKVSRKPSKPDSEIIEAGSMQLAQVQISHRKDIARLRGIVDKLVAELEQQADAQTAQLLGRLGALMDGADDKGVDKLGELYRKVISLPERTKTAKTLAETLRLAVDMERQAFGMDARAQQDVQAYQGARIALEFVAPDVRQVADAG